MTEFLTLEGKPLDDAPREAKWVGGADCYLAEWGEYERSGASWTYNKVLREASRKWRPGYGRSGHEFDVKAKLHIGGKHQRGRYIPTYWSMAIEFGKYSDRQLPKEAFPYLKGTCRSIADALRKANAAITDDRVQALMKLGYSRNIQTRSIYRLKDDVLTADVHYDAVLYDPANWEPWASDCSTSHVWAWFPPGRYFEVSREHNGTLHGSYIKSSGGCTSGGGSPEFTQLAQVLGGWTCTEIERLIEAAPHEVWCCFDKDAAVKVETVTWPESGTSQVFIVIETALGVDDARECLRKLEDRWWLKVMPKDGSLALDLRLL